MMVGFLDNIVISSVFIFSLVASFQTKEECLIKILKCPLAKNGIKTEAGWNDKKGTKNCKTYSVEKNTIAFFTDFYHLAGWRRRAASWKLLCFHDVPLARERFYIVLAQWNSVLFQRTDAR